MRSPCCTDARFLLDDPLQEKPLSRRRRRLWYSRTTRALPPRLRVYRRRGVPGRRLRTVARTGRIYLRSSGDRDHPPVPYRPYPHQAPCPFQHALRLLHRPLRVHLRPHPLRARRHLMDLFRIHLRRTEIEIEKEGIEIGRQHHPPTDPQHLQRPPAPPPPSERCNTIKSRNAQTVPPSQTP